MTTARRDFTSVTELPEGRATREQLAMVRTRYHEAEKRSAGRRVLEVACGPGRGLGLLARRASFVVGGDVTFELVHRAKAYYGARMKVLQMDAQRMPFADASFDLLVLFEALYYLPDADGFMRECRRVLGPGGTVLISAVNPEWDGSSPSPMSTQYLSARELEALLRKHGFEPEIWAAFPVETTSRAANAVAAVRRTVVKCGLMPRTLHGRELLKRIFYGRLRPLGPEVDESAEFVTPVRLRTQGPFRNFKILFAVGNPQTAGET